jgi:hypothetical protein
VWALLEAVAGLISQEVLADNLAAAVVAAALEVSVAKADLGPVAVVQQLEAWVVVALVLEEAMEVQILAGMEAVVAVLDWEALFTFKVTAASPS